MNHKYTFVVLFLFFTNPFYISLHLIYLILLPTPFEPRREKTGLRGFRPGPTQTGLYKLRNELEA